MNALEWRTIYAPMGGLFWNLFYDDLHTLVYILLMASQSFAYDVTMARQMRRDHVNDDI